MTETALVAGRPVTGDKTYHGNEDKPEQRPIEDFVEWLDLVLGVSGVDSVRWRQYTPYWNDGEPCTFRVGDVGVKLAGDDEESGDYEDGYRGTWSLKPDKSYAPPERLAGVAEGALEALEEMTYQGKKSYYDALLAAFGDHAVVTATREGFAIEYYEHD